MGGFNIEFLKCDHSKNVLLQSLRVVLCDMKYRAVPTFRSMDEILKCANIQMKVI